MIRPPKVDPKMRKVENLSIQEISKRYPGKQFNSPQAQRELKMSLKRNYNAAGFPGMASEVENSYRLQGNTKQASLGGLAARVGLGALSGGISGYMHGNAAGDGSAKSRYSGALSGALFGGLTGGLMHGFRSLGGPRASFNLPGAENALTGLTGMGLSAGAGYLGSKMFQKAQPDLYRPDYLTDVERRENVEIQQLVSQLKAAGGHFDRMNPQSAMRLRSLMANPATSSRVQTMFRGSGGYNKYAAYMSMYTADDQGNKQLVPYNDPRAIEMAKSQMFQEQLHKRIALMQLQRLQQIEALRSTLTPDYRNQYAQALTQAYLAGQLQRPQPSEEQTRSMINSYMDTAGVDTKSPKAQKAADKYDGVPPKKYKKSKNDQKPVRIKSKNTEKEASFGAKEIQILEKVAGSSYPTIIGNDGYLAKNVNGNLVKVSSDPVTTGVESLTDLDGLQALAEANGNGLSGPSNSVGAAAALLGLTGLGYGGYKLYKYLTRDKRTRAEKLYDSGKAMLPHLLQSYQAYKAMQGNVQAAARQQQMASAYDPRMRDPRMMDPRMMRARMSMQQPQMGHQHGRSHGDYRDIG